jgi:hypothetical protein
MLQQESAHEKNLALNALKKLKEEIDILSDEGAYSYVAILMPQNIESTEIGTNFIKVRIRNQDIAVKTQNPIDGNIQFSAGYNLIYLRKEDGIVKIYMLKLKPNRATIFLKMKRNSTEDINLDILNMGDRNERVDFFLEWEGGDINCKIDKNYQYILPGHLGTVKITFNSSQMASGEKSGFLIIHGYDMNFPVPLKVKVDIPTHGLEIYSNIHLETDENSTLDANARVCNSIDENIYGISFYSSGEISDWIDPPENIDLLLPGECTFVDFNINVPLVESSGTYCGELHATDGYKDNHINICLDVTAYS